MTNSRKNNCRGFSLIEVLITISVVGVIGVFLSNLVTRSYKDNLNSVITSDIKQNGQTALAMISNDIRNSERVVCPKSSQTPPLNSEVLTSQILVLFTKSEGKYIRYIFYQHASDPMTIAKQTLTLDANVTDPCDYTSNNPPADSSGVASSNTNFITNNNVTSGVMLSNQSFQIYKKQGYKDTVSIKFDIAGVGSTNIANPITFQTSVQLR